MWATVAALLFLALAVRCALARRYAQKAPRIHGGFGDDLRIIFGSMPGLARVPLAPLGLSGLAQLVLFAVQMILEEFWFTSAFDSTREEFAVSLPGESTTGCPDRVAVEWIKAQKGKAAQNLPDDAPIVIILPGLNCYAANLPGTSMYKELLGKSWRVGVFEKRGVGPAGSKGLKSPVFHLFGHPSDLHEVVTRVCSRWPKANLHLVGLSSGNGLCGSYTTLYGGRVPALKGSLLLIGGEDYNVAFAPPKADWRTRLVFDVTLLESTKSRFLRKNEAVLRRHSEVGYAACMAAQNLQDLYDLCMTYFSGYSDRDEAERQINGFSGSNECLMKIPVPFLVVYTEDDPVAPGGPRPEWVEVMDRCEKAAIAMFPSGSHLGCYDSWGLSRWVDKLAAEWVVAVELRCSGRG
mmetsp:Transcript_81087/g.232979  ORF Transcript_81087/g.232979 Transcript_81087/m.232979 type:complete len:408 (+) Transcript_81087:59-1282(+)